MSHILSYSILEQYRFIPKYTGIKEDLIGCWEFDETSGTTAYNSHPMRPRKYHGTIDGATINQTGKVGNCFSFDGDNDLVRLPIRDHFTDFSFSCWFYATGWGEIDNGYLFYKRDSDGPTSIFGSYIHGGGGFENIMFYQSFSGGVSQWRTANKLILLNRWYHFAVTYNNSSPTNTPIIYLNGSPIATTVYSTGSGTTVKIPDRYHIGNSGVKDRSFKGLIDQVAMWRRILTSGEVAALYNSGNGLAYSSW